MEFIVPFVHYVEEDVYFFQFNMYLIEIILPPFYPEKDTS